MIDHRLLAGRFVEAVRSRAKDAVTGPQSLFFPAPIPAPDLRKRDDGTVWLWDGYLATDAITLWSALWKAGKTTLLAHLYRSMGGGDEFCGRAVRPGSALVVSEESESVLADRRDKVGLGDWIRFVIRPFKLKPDAKGWESFLDWLGQTLVDCPADLVVFDSLSNLWPVRNENDAGEVQAALMPLRAVSEGRSLLLVHHARKGDGAEATSSRGSGALAAFADILVELRRFNPDARDDRRRVLTGYGRYDATPGELTVELTDDGYVAHGDRAEAVYAELAPLVRAVLPAGPPGLSTAEIEETVGTAKRGPLLKALGKGLGVDWQRGGAGKKNDPFRYWRKDA